MTDLVAELRRIMAEGGVVWKAEAPGEEGHDFFVLAAGFLMGERAKMRAEAAAEYKRGWDDGWRSATNLAKGRGLSE